MTMSAMTKIDGRRRHIVKLKDFLLLCCSAVAPVDRDGGRVRLRRRKKKGAA